MAEQPKNIVQLALKVQLSIAQLDPLQETLKLIEQLCEQITGVEYPIDLNERHSTYQQQRQQETERAVAKAISTQGAKSKGGRPKGSKTSNDTLRKQIDASFRKGQQ